MEDSHDFLVFKDDFEKEMVDNPSWQSLPEEQQRVILQFSYERAKRTKRACGKDGSQVMLTISERNDPSTADVRLKVPNFDLTEVIRIADSLGYSKYAYALYPK